MLNLQQIIFVFLLGVVVFFAAKGYGRLIRNIKLGRDKKIEGNAAQRWKNVLLIAFGQKKMFKKPIAATLHLGVYVAFLFTQIELIEILADGILGLHRVFAPFLGQLYTFIISFIEFLSLFALVATFAFLARRNLLQLPRFHKSEMGDWPKLDANIILIAEIVLVVGIFLMNASDMALQYHGKEGYPLTGKFFFSSHLSVGFFQTMEVNTLVILERLGWWLHILVVFGFLLYLPFSKHLHILLAFPNTYFSDLDNRGRMENIPEITKEIKLMMGLSQDSQTEEEAIPEFGAKDVTDLHWKNLLDAYTCTECGRCTSVCPANITGKKLSPRKIMMDVRDRTEELGRFLDGQKKESLVASALGEGETEEQSADGRNLFDFISREELHACTTCNACVEACPVLINPLDIILQLRRYEILTESSGPSDWVPMFTAIENNGAVWQMSSARDAWREI
jgi:heterodisulfide reductase subunit C